MPDDAAFRPGTLYLTRESVESYLGQDRWQRQPSQVMQAMLFAFLSPFSLPLISFSVSLCNFLGFLYRSCQACCPFICHACAIGFAIVYINYADVQLTSNRVSSSATSCASLSASASSWNFRARKDFRYLECTNQPSLNFASVKCSILFNIDNMYKHKSCFNVG